MYTHTPYCTDVHSILTVILASLQNGFSLLQLCGPKNKMKERILFPGLAHILWTCSLALLLFELKSALNEYCTV